MFSGAFGGLDLVVWKLNVQVSGDLLEAKDFDFFLVTAQL